MFRPNPHGIDGEKSSDKPKAESRCQGPAPRAEYLKPRAGKAVRGRGPEPRASAKRRNNDLTPEKEEIWKKWIGLYKEKMLSRGEYLGGLYDLGFDRPEAHAIRKPEGMYYAFYAPEYKGRIELRGLDRRAYTVRDYENGRDLGVVRGPAGALDVQFSKHLLLEAKPQ